jgi:DNA-binding response OmpR family regulator
MKILIIEDDAKLALMIKEGLSAESHTVEISSDGADGAFLAKNYEYDAIILDYSLPKKDGIQVAKDIRSTGKNTPILFLSVTEDPEVKVQALENGADDYITKPFSLKELFARIRAVSRRPKVISQPVLTVGDLVMDTEKSSVVRGESTISLTRKEYNLLEYFMKHVGIVLSRALIMEHVWTADSDPLSNTCEAHIRNLRKKINSGNKPNLIENIPGRGYVIRLPNIEKTGSTSSAGF